ncbi:hypothetical protein ABZ297_42220 [Nonomuraea sp. NPDC005983]|uniref:hypothetical protein n=1 Tax=Nonomuraea sp. NPDC005983 TaxID=3155595 RepID=UPI0033BAF67B
MPTPSAPVTRRVRNLAVLEFVNIPIISLALIGRLGMPLTPANLTGLLLVLVLLAEGGAYWWLKLAQLTSRSAVPAGIGVYRVLARVNLALLAGGAVVIGAGLVRSGFGTQVWPGLALWVFAVLEYVNYFHLQLMHDNRADLSRLARTGRLHRSHLARDLARASARPR